MRSNEVSRQGSQTRGVVDIAIGVQLNIEAVRPSRASAPTWLATDYLLCRVANIQQTIGYPSFLGEVFHVGRMESRRTLPRPGGECHRLARFSLSSQLRNRFSQLANQYGVLAEAEELGTLSYDDRPNGWRLT
jgi:hypothetical protein